MLYYVDFCWCYYRTFSYDPSLYRIVWCTVMYHITFLHPIVMKNIPLIRFFHNLHPYSNRTCCNFYTIFTLLSILNLFIMYLRYFEFTFHSNDNYYYCYFVLVFFFVRFLFLSGAYNPYVRDMPIPPTKLSFNYLLDPAGLSYGR